jgi:hypothetical protein
MNKTVINGTPRSPTERQQDRQRESKHYPDRRQDQGQRQPIPQ